MKNKLTRFCSHYFSAVLLLASFTLSLTAQTNLPNKEEDADHIQNQNLEMLSEDLQGEDNDYTNLIEQLKYFATHPINLNHTSKEELTTLGLLNELQIAALLDHIERNGKLMTVYELQSINGFDLLTIKRILPFIKVSDQFDSPHFGWDEIKKYGKHEIVTRFQTTTEKQSGYLTRPGDDEISYETPDSFYLGTPHRIFQRYRFTYGNNISIGFIAEKDAGEAFRAIKSLNKKAGFDFYTAHFFLRNIRFIKAFAVGDYQASFGQGLTLWRGFGFGKNAMIASVKRNARGLNQYNSVDENRFMRGAATTLKVSKRLELTAFYSNKKTDGNIVPADSITSQLFDAEETASLITGGYHNTVGTIEDKAKITEQITGGNITYRGKRLVIGTTVAHFLLSTPLQKSYKYYNQFDFRGKENLNAGIDFSYIFKNINFFGEAAYSKNGGKAFCGGAIAALDPKFNMAVYYRNFDRNYQNLLAVPIGENTLPQNEKGLYFGIEAKPLPQLMLSAFIDNFQFPWLKSNANAPSAGHDFFAQATWTPSKKIEMYVRYRNRTKEINSSIENQFDYLTPYVQQNFRYNVSFSVHPTLKLRTRLEAVKITQEDETDEHGFVLFQDIVWKKHGWPLTVTARYGMFETDSYNSRVYTFENDVIYSFSIPALYNKGQRYYLMVNYDISKKIELWVRFAQTFYSDQEILYSGDNLQEIKGPAKSELKLQLRLKL